MPLFAKALERAMPDGTDAWVGLLRDEPDEVDGTYAEIAAGGYARVVHDAWVTADNGDGRIARRNNGAVVFAALTDPETIFSHWGIFDAALDGNLIAAGPVLNGDGVPQPATVTTGNQPRFNDGDIRLLSSEAG
jgi:hypothetical protein